MSTIDPTAWLAERQRLADAGDPEDNWVRYSVDFRGHRSHTVKSSCGSVVAHVGYGPDGESVYSAAESIVDAHNNAPTAYAALAAVLDLHQSDGHEEWSCGELGCEASCSNCEWPFPCPTVVGIRAILEGAHDV